MADFKFKFEITDYRLPILLNPGLFLPAAFNFWPKLVGAIYELSLQDFDSSFCEFKASFTFCWTSDRTCS